MNSHHRQILLALSLAAALLLGGLMPGAVSAQESAPTAAAAPGIDFDNPRDCIIPLKVAHIAASLAGLIPVPVPGYATAAALAEFGANLALKGCQPELIPPDAVVEPPPTDCVYRMSLPLNATWNELHVMDDALFRLMLEEFDIPQALRPGLIDLIESEYGRFENEVYGSYSNIYGIVLPLELSEWAPGNWGDVGNPEIFHYNSDVFITLRHPGKRVSPQMVVVRPGSYVLHWQADTMISIFDKIPLGVLYTAFNDTPAQHKARKEAAVKAARKQLENVVDEVTEELAEQTAEEITKNLFLKTVAKKLATKVAITGGLTKTKLRQPYFVSGDANATSTATQRLIVQDHTPPVIRGADDPVVVEALLPGGASAAATIGKLLEQVIVSDDCDLDPTLRYNTPSFWPLQVDEQGNPLPSAEIKWTAKDNGAATPTGGVNETTQTQQVIVQDTLPPIIQAPPPVIMESDGGVEVPLGSPQVFDVADLRPSIDYEAPTSSQGTDWPVFGQGVHYVEWWATDRSQNRSENARQLVNIKAPGTNLPAQALPISGGETIQAVADEPIKITVRGQDGNSPPDPLWFTVEDQPENGFFIAPLYPYFIDDYRMTARYSPQIAAERGEEFAWALAADPSAMRDYIKELCAEDIQRRDLPKDFVSWNGGSSKYIAVDDEGFTYIYDSAYRRCTPGGSTIAPYTTPRISVWDQDGLYVGEIEQSSGSRPLRDVQFNVGQGTILMVYSDGSSTGNSFVRVMRTQPENRDEPIVETQAYALWNKINDIYVGPDNTRRGPEFKNADSVALDTRHNVLYVAGWQNLTGLAAFQPAPCNSGGGDGPEDCLNLLGTPVYSSSIVQSTKWGDTPGIGHDAMRLWNINDIAVDSQGALYVVANSSEAGVSAAYMNRIYKFAPVTVHEDGSMTPGELIGWMGKCSSGPGCNYIDGRSIGFSCTDETCTVEDGTGGSRPGQFNRIAAIAIDPKDVLYVADSGNKRVQRFSTDGLFAGEARSQDACEGCSGFVLGDFGSPGNISVNSGHFYIVDVDSELVHIFEASVIHSIDDSSAWVEYQSDSNYVGPDWFTFRTTDGFRTAGSETREGKLIESAPARVDISVSRNFRPPIADDSLAVQTAEDTPAAVTLNGFDLDRELDTLTYRITRQPDYGSVSDGTGAERTFTPDPDFWGPDSFDFVVSDGREESAPVTVPISVTGANDAPTVALVTDPLTAGTGFAFTLEAEIIDADADDSHQFQLDWGDGTVERKGDIQADGSLSGPILLADSSITSTILGFHTYTSPGDKPLELCVWDALGTVGCIQRTVTVQARVDVALSRQGDAVVPADGRSLTYALTVENRAPNAGGISAADVTLRETLEAGAMYQKVDPNGDFTCSASGRTLTCPLGAMTVGSKAQVIVTVALADGLEPGAEVLAESEATTASPDAIPENNRLSVPLALLPAADFTVTSLEEGGDATPGDGICQSTGGGCTLRAAIEEANQQPGAQTIALGYGVHQLNVQEESGRLRASANPLVVSDDLTILGLSPNRTVINANGGSRVVRVDSATLTLRGLMLSGGAVSGDDGGGVLVVNGGLVLEEVAVAGNSARNGGGVMAHGSTVTIRRSALTDNRAVAVEGEQGFGGGVHVRGGNLTVENSTLSGNSAERGGALFSDGGAVALQNVTAVGNSARREGGGIHATGDGVTLRNTILAGNGAGLGPNCLGRISSGGHNLLGDLNSCTVLGDTSSNLLAGSVQWMGRDRTHADTYAHDLPADSRAVDAGSCALSTDQRGTGRPAGNGCDIGAIEYDPLAGMDEVVYLPALMR